MAFECKLDGARVQIHKAGETVRVYSRRLTDITESLPEIMRIVPHQVKANQAILDGEIIAVSKENGRPLPFQYLMRRFRRIHQIESMIEEIPIELQLFDVIYVNGKSFLDVPYCERRKKMRAIIGDIRLTKQKITRSEHEASEFLEEALHSGHEGLIAKKIDSPYSPGSRGKYWFKIKRTLEALDLVIVAAEWGYGRRHNWLSDYHLAARDTETDKFIVIGKTFKGLNDQEIAEMTQRLQKLSIREDVRRVQVIPKIIVEVAYNEIQKSSKYTSGMALRFARIKRIRVDKSPEDVDTIQHVREIFEKQYEKKAKY
jgi:DNA ligase-1